MRSPLQRGRVPQKATTTMEQMNPQKPTVGRLVHYKLPHGRSAGQIRPAVIVRVWGEDHDSAVQLQVFTDGGNDNLIGPYQDASAEHPAQGMIWATSVVRGDGAGQYSWPPRV